MTSHQTTIGIDISKDQLDCYAMPTGKRKSFANSPAGIKSCIKWICKHPDIFRIVFEPTGGLERSLLKALQDEKLPAARVSAFCVNHFRKAKNDLAKTDDLDAMIIAHFGVAMKPEITKPIPPHLEELGELVHRRRCLNQTLSAESTRVNKTTSERCRECIEDHIRYLKTCIKNLEAEIKLILKGPELKAKSDVLMKNKGISHIAAATILAEMPELGTLKRPQVGKLLGVAPMNTDSGKSTGKRRIRGGRRELRNCLYMSTLTAVRGNDSLGKFFKSLKEKGKPHKVAMMAAMRKLIIRVNAQMANHINGKEVVYM